MRYSLTKSRKTLKVSITPNTFLDVGDVLADRRGNRRVILVKTHNMFLLSHRHSKYPGKWRSLEEIINMKNVLIVPLNLSTGAPANVNLEEQLK